MPAARIPRNAPCPCGSGRKHKLCCGTTREQELQAKRVGDVLEELLGLARVFPLLRPEARGFDAWVRGLHAELECSREVLEDGLRALGRRERRRIAGAASRGFHEVWPSYVRDLGDEALARECVLVGAVLVGIDERLALDAADVEQIAWCDFTDPAEVIACAFRPTDLWSVYEAGIADAALGRIDVDDDLAGKVLSVVCVELATSAHERRLRRIVARLRSRVPDIPAGEPLLHACDAFFRDESIRARVPILMLEDAVGAIPLDVLRAAA